MTVPLFVFFGGEGKKVKMFDKLVYAPFRSSKSVAIGWGGSGKIKSLGWMKIRENYRTLEGSFSAVSTPIFTTKYAFCSSFRDLQDSKTFAPLQIQKFAKF